jgi:hypothetical protein
MENQLFINNKIAIDEKLTHYTVIFVYQGQKVHLLNSSLAFLVEAQPRLENRPGQKVLFGRSTHNVFRVHLGKHFEKYELIVNFEVIFDRCQVRYIK